MTAPSAPPAALLVRVDVAPDLEEQLLAWAWAAGCLGAETAPSAAGVELRIYLPAHASGAEELVARALALGARRAEREEVPSADWLEPWRLAAAPVRSGRFLLDPREPSEVSVAAGEGVEVLRLPARRAFGTGSHESTQLALELLEISGGVTGPALDLGCGTGVLAFAAMRLGVRPVLGIDLDLEAAAAARDNSRLNRCFPWLVAGRIEALARRPIFRLALLNMLPENLAGAEAALVARMAVGGKLVLSGVLASRRSEIEERWAALGMRRASCRERGEWCGLLLERVRP